MAERLFDSVQTHLGTDTMPHPAKAAPDTPFRILFIGDFSGRAHRGVVESNRISQARSQLIDRDNFEDVMRKLGGELQLQPLGANSQAIEIGISSVEDFHPDVLYEKTCIFQELRDTRKRLSDPKTFAQAKAEVSSWTRTAAAPVTSAPPPIARSAGVTGPASNGASLLDQMLGGTPLAPVAGYSERGWDALLRQLVAPHVIPAADPMQAELMGYVDTALSVLMRAVLHDPHFQAMEAAWRALAMAVRDIETGTKLKLYVLDVTKAEFAAALETSDDERESAWHRLLADDAVEKFGDEGWALVAANYTFEGSATDLEILNGAASVAQAAGVPLVATAGAKLLGCSSLANTPNPEAWREPLECGGMWAALRSAPQSCYLGLALPRILLRMPYGKNTDAVERFSFEEIDGNWHHENYLWGSPAIACALLLGRTFSTAGWDFTAAIERDIDGLPLHIYREAGESIAKPCAEIALSEHAANRMLECGVMPFASIKNEDRVRLVRLQSIASNGSALAGRWA